MNKKQEAFLLSQAKNSIPFETRLFNAGIELDSLANLTSSKRYRLINLEPLHSLFLNKNSQFQQLYKELDNWNEEIKKAIIEDKEINNGVWRECLMTNMAMMMREVVITTERVTQKLYLDQVHKWFYKTLHHGKPRYPGNKYEREDGMTLTKLVSALHRSPSSSTIMGTSDMILETPLLRKHRRNDSDGAL